MADQLAASSDCHSLKFSNPADGGGVRKLPARNKFR
jgi:hypothetical protein